jgi:hypothetical protein
MRTTSIATTIQTRLEAGCIYDQIVAADQIAIDFTTITTTTNITSIALSNYSTIHPTL